LEGDAAAHRCDYPPLARRLEQRRDSERAAPAEPVSVAPPHPVLALQRQIGNRAVGALLAREPKPKTPPKEPEQLKDGVWAFIPEIGTVQLRSVQLGVNRRMTNPTGQSTSREASAPQISEIMVTADLGSHSDKIFRWSLNGRAKTVEIRFVKDGKVYMTVKLHQTLVSSYTVSGHGGVEADQPSESWSLNATKVEYETEHGRATTGE
jgi:type VI protein secretion system component Hcp